jgi:peptidoglycan hydrolase CwlO-like protein
MEQYTQPLPVNNPKEVWFSKTNVISYIIIFTLLIIIVGGWFKHDSQYKDFEDQIKKSDIKLDSLSKKNQELDTKTYYLEQYINGIDNKVNNNNKELNNLKKEFNEKDKDIDTYSYDELYRSITNRYGYDKNDVPNKNN